MSKLSKRKLRNLILKEFEKMSEEQLLHRHKGPGMNRTASDYRIAKHTSCGECGSSMYEGETTCEQCGYSMQEEETREEYDALNEGDCGCDSDYVTDYDINNNFIPDHMDQNKIEDLILNAITTDMHSYDDNDNIKIGNHKAYKGSYMAKNHMYKVAKYAEKIYNMIPDGHNLEDWMRSKLAQIADDISEVYHALDHDKFKGDI